MKVIVDQEQCAASGMCAMTAPDVFEQGEDGISVVLLPDPPPAQADEVRDAVASCPARAISLEDD